LLKFYYKANIEIKDKFGKTAFDRANSMKIKEIIRKPLSKLERNNNEIKNIKSLPVTAKKCIIRPIESINESELQNEISEKCLKNKKIEKENMKRMTGKELEKAEKMARQKVNDFVTRLNSKIKKTFEEDEKDCKENVGEIIFNKIENCEIQQLKQPKFNIENVQSYIDEKIEFEARKNADENMKLIANLINSKFDQLEISLKETVLSKIIYQNSSNENTEKSNSGESKKHKLYSRKDKENEQIVENPFDKNTTENNTFQENANAEFIINEDNNENLDCSSNMPITNECEEGGDIIQEKSKELIEIENRIKERLLRVQKGVTINNN